MFLDIKNQIDKILDYYKRNSFLSSLKHIFEKLGFEHSSKSLIFMVLNLEDISEVVETPYSFHNTTIADIQDEQDHYFEHKYQFSKREFLYRMKKGHHVYVFKEDNKMVFFLWTEQKGATITVFHMPLHLPQYTSYISGVFTMPGYRNRGIAHKIMKEVIHYLKEAGFTKLLCVVNPKNNTALNIYNRLGFKKYQIVHYKRFWQVRRYTAEKFNSDERKVFISLFSAPKDIWKTFL